MNIQVERITFYCDTCHKAVITRKGDTLMTHPDVARPAVERHRQQQPDKPHVLRVKVDGVI